MPRRGVKARLPWEDRFYAPSLAQLLSCLSKDHAGLIMHARKTLLAAAPGPESICWLGVPWRWTIVLRSAGDDQPWAYLVPQPGRPRIALPLDIDLIAAIPARGLSRYLRDGLAAAPRVASTCWAEWDLLSRTQTDELLVLARHRLEQALAPVA